MGIKGKFGTTMMQALQLLQLPERHVTGLNDIKPVSTLIIEL